jgi:transposase
MTAMDSSAETHPLSPEAYTAVVAERDRLGEENRRLQERLASIQHQLDWLKRQVFGEQSERRLRDAPPEQMSLGEGLETRDEPVAPPQQKIPAHTRRVSGEKPLEGEDESALFFDNSVPVQIIEVPNPELEGLAEDEYEVIGEKISHRLAQRPGSYVILKYVRQVIKRRDDQSLHCPPAPQGVLDNSRADVSFIAALMVDKFIYHQPLYRQHQRLKDNGIEASRPWLTALAHSAAALLEPIYAAQFDSVRESRVKAMDETPIKAGRKGKGKMKTGYFWPVYGERDEIVFPFFPSRAAKCVHEALGQPPPPQTPDEAPAVLISDGYSAYARYAEQAGLSHAQCWTHTRRQFVKAEKAEPDAAGYALDAIGELYAVEKHIREQALTGEKKRRHRVEHAKPVVERLFAWAEQQMDDAAFLPTNPLTKALGYLLERRAGLEVYLADPEVPIDTNHLERALRVIPMGRKNWMFAWTEVGAKYVGIFQSLLVTCRMQGINPYDYLVDVLQRINHHPAAEVHLLTPRLWKQHFANNPLRSPLHTLKA